MTTEFIDLHHQYGISVVESQMFLLAKGPSAAMSDEKRLPFAGYFYFSCSVFVHFFTKNKGETGLSKMKLMRGYIGFQNIDWTVTEYKLVLQIW